MVFDRARLSARPGMNINAGQSWGYNTPDATAVVAGATYFNVAADVLNLGDIIDVVSDTGTTPALRTYVVTAITKPSAGVAGDVTHVLQTTVA